MKNKDMEKEHEIKTVVPALRFPEFRGMEGWRKSYIYEECPNSYSGGTPKTTEKIFYGGNIPFIRSAEIGKNKTELYITQEGLNNSSAKMIQKGDLLIALYGANSGDIAIAKIDGAINQAILCLRAKENNLFIYYTLQKNKKNIVSKYLQGGQGNLSAEIIKSIVFYIQKIADCLSSLDDLIEATNRKIEVLKEHKKGLMQRLFPKEGKNVPELRFPEFQETKGWAKKQIIDLGEVITGNTPSKKEGKYWNGDFAWITAQDFKGKYINDSILKLTRFGKNKARVIPQNSVLVTCIASIGLNAINKIECSTNQQINTICCNRKYHYEYVYYLITYNVKRLKQLAGQTAVPIITKKNFEEFEVYTVENYDEQQKIADCLSSLDELIEATSQKVEILKEHKKGLMQQLFPKI